MLPVIFCPDCNTFLDSQASACPACGRKRLPSERLPEPGQPLWLRYVEGAIHSAVMAGSLVVYNAGERNKPCGVYAFEQSNGELRWSFPTRHSVEAGVTLFGTHLYFATCGFLGSGAQLFCLEAETGRKTWEKELTAGVWSRPLVDEARVYIGQEDGQVLCFANRDGTPLCYQPVGLPRGRVWLELVDGVLLALSGQGQILALNPLALERIWHTPLELDGGITSPPCAADGQVFFGGEGGQLLRLDLRSRKVTLLTRVPGNIVAAPAYADGVLFFGAVSKSDAHEHYLHACDPDTGQPLWKSPEFKHSLSSQPFAGEGLVVAGFTQTGLILLDARTGEFAWDFPARSEARLFSHPILHEGSIYAGTDTGHVFALPWHLGKYDWAARLCKARGDCEQAGTYYVLAAQNTLKEDKKEGYYQQAVACWQDAGRMELAGRLLWEGLIEEEKAAEAYIKAGKQWKGTDNQRAAEYYNLAAQLYHQLDNEAEEKSCAQLAQKLALGPLLRIKPWNIPSMTQYQEGRITFRLENVGRRDAVGLTLNLGGSLMEPVTCQVEDSLPPGENSYFDITLTIVPSKAQNELVIQAEYGAAGAKKRYFSTSHAIVDAAEAPIEVEMTDVVALKGIKITNPQNRRMHIKLDGVIAPNINIGDTLPIVAPAPAEFIWPDPPSGLKATETILIRVEQVEEDITVPAAHWAIFLADEAAIATVAPGHYSRRNYHQLQSKLTDRHLPVWKAVLINSSPFRLAYRLGPFRTREDVRVGVECGVTAQLEDNHPFEMWKGILGEVPNLTTQGLARWLENEVSGTLKVWIAAQPEAVLTIGFGKREEVMLSLEEQLKPTHACYGIALQDPLYLLNFVIPGRERLAGTHEEIYWQQQERIAGAANNFCPHCGASLPPDARHCDNCGLELG